ncbi:MAG: 23S rRNA (adenine(2503)-C(2))-methyltransferase RlmN [Deltaproteobacteria bacterium]|nr:MAG: 23S rRNA (adenine(2503)-C(2))-methyltransferase RlmN [Deltaproteobacteria bacterium]
MSRTDLKNLSPDELADFFAGLGEKAFRARQMLRWLYQRDVSDFDSMTDLSKALRARLAEIATVSDLRPEQVLISRDGTRKYLFRLRDGQTVESVRIPMDEGRTTLCISSQVGCAMGCAFCLTGTFGLQRNLSAAEIVNQVLAARRDGPVNNIVFMGMGEPLHNLDNVVRALHILYAGEGLNYGPRRVTLSTSGLVPELRELGRRVRVGLAISLNATTNELRDQLMPVNRRYPIEELLQACRDYPLQPRERITFEYVLLGGVNDSLADAKRLVRLMHGVPAKINLITYNEHDGSAFQAPDPEAVDAFQGYLLNHGLVAVRRASKGQDILAACGQLKAALDNPRT